MIFRNDHYEHMDVHHDHSENHYVHHDHSEIII